MNSGFAFAASLALLLPAFGSVTGESSFETHSDPAQCSKHEVEPASHSDRRAARTNGAASKSANSLGAHDLIDYFRHSNRANQVRIERRVTIRISPYRQSNRTSMLARLPSRGLAGEYEERKMEGCVPVSGIAGVQTGNGNRLLLFLNDQRIVSLNLERGCRARDFYSGFYVERNKDGRLCVKRDQLQSRSGAKCEVAGMRRLVAVEE